MIFTERNYSHLKQRLHRKYQGQLKTLYKSLKSFSSPELESWLIDNKGLLDGYSAIKWNFIQQAHSYINMLKITPELSLVPTEFTEIDNEVFEQWGQSEFADVFLKTLNKGKSIGFSTDVALKHVQEHLITFGERHFLRMNSLSSSYRTQTSLGEYKKGKKIHRMLETTLHLNGKDLVLMTPTLKEMREFSLKIERALKVITKFSPGSWERFKAFTEVIIPIKQSEFVSYSHQELPGYSMINLYDRDFVDLIDDLLHENGHHHLNYYLNLSKVIEEPQDYIYYSPWRRTLRPLRGIYHAYFTFFWAFELFSSIASAKEQDSIFYTFGAKEKEKIYWRAVEEYWMLNYTYKDLVRANKQGLISDVGWKFIQEQRKLLVKNKKKVLIWEKKLRIHLGPLKDLKKTLKKAHKDYQAN